MSQPAEDTSVVAIMDTFRMISIPFFAAMAVCILWHVMAAFKAKDAGHAGAAASIRTRHLYTAAEIIGTVASLPDNNDGM